MLVNSEAMSPRGMARGRLFPSLILIRILRKGLFRIVSSNSNGLKKALGVAILRLMVFGLA